MLVSHFGLRNYNPGNIRDVGIGLEGKFASNKGFFVFDDVSWLLEP
jgi:hypothetical protein